MSKLATNWGINAEQVSTHKNAMEYSLFEKPSESFIDETRESVENVYNIFLNRVAEGRKMSVEQVDEVAQGRVWSGENAKKVGLVDEIGNLEDVLAFVSKENEIDSYRVVSYPIFKTNIKDFFGGYSISLKSKYLESELGVDAYKVYQKIKNLSQQKGIQARMFFDINLD